MVIKHVLFIENILFISIDQWQVGKGKFTNFADATEPIPYSLLSFLKLSTSRRLFLKTCLGTLQWRMCILTEAQILEYQDEYPSP